MIEFILFYLLSWPALATILVLGVLAEHYSCTKWAVFLAILAGVVAYTMFGVPLINLVIIAVAYFITGVIWSFWRYTRFVKAGVKTLVFSSQSEKERKINELSPKRNVGTIVRWVLVWPLSLVSSVVGDIITFAQKLVTETFKKVYASIFNSYTKGL